MGFTKTVCKQDMCTGCMTCFSVCSKNAISIIDTMKAFNAVKTDTCVNCGLCEKLCPQNNPATFLDPIFWVQGWSKEDSFHRDGASGGIASSLAKVFIADGGVVCSCVFENGEFNFKMASSIDDLYQFAGSKYVKSNPSGIFQTIKTYLLNDLKVLFIGLPCQVSGLKNYLGMKLLDRLYTIDLICHGTPSSKLLNHFLSQYNVSLSGINNIIFRSKRGYTTTAAEYASLTLQGVVDYYTVSFLGCLTYTENCYACQYAQKARVSDITLGDSWGTKISGVDYEKGVSLVLCQTEKGKQLIKLANIETRDVDIDVAVAHNSQLKHPSIKPFNRVLFFNRISNGKSFNSSVFFAMKYAYLKQIAKKMMIKLGLKKLKNGVVFGIKIKNK